jgi:DNA replication protein DnaC
LFSTSIYKNAEQKRRSLKAKELCELFAGELALNGLPGLVIMGETGVGKTFLLDCIGRRALERGRSVQKYTAYNIVDMMLRAIRERTAAEDLTAPELLLIDDLGTEPMVPSITFEALFAAVNERGNAGRATVVATNLDRAAILESYGERIFSRLFSQRGYSVIELRGNDLRIN